MASKILEVCEWGEPVRAETLTETCLQDDALDVPQPY